MFPSFQESSCSPLVHDIWSSSGTSPLTRWLGFSHADILTAISDSLQRDEQSTAANLLICRRRQGLVMTCGGLLLDPLRPSVIDTVRLGRWLYFLQRWMLSVAPFTYCIFQCLPWGREPWWNLYWLYKCLMSKQQQQLVAERWWNDDTGHMRVPVHRSNRAPHTVWLYRCILLNLFSLFFSFPASYRSDTPCEASVKPPTAFVNLKMLSAIAALCTIGPDIRYEFA